MSTILTIVQARMTSTRLPGKVMLPLMDKPLLVRMMDRVLESKNIGKAVVATTMDPEDDIIEEVCNKNKFEVFRGDRDDLLDRHYQAAKKYNADVVLKIPSDCPIIDSSIIDRVVAYFLDNDIKFDYVSNLHPASYPDGNDVEVMTMKSLEYAWKHADKKMEREHTTPYIWENPDKFKIGNISWEKGLDYSMSHRWTIDYKEDYQFIKTVFESLYPKKNKFTLEDILDLLDRKPGLSTINDKYAGVNWYRNHLDELKTINKKQTKILKDF
ncbi:MAG TPA: glycosyltransferase family protein [Cytophagaceae bacterium]|jgi:spore coat polysaccharide biosynthesis protein SpsF|nr:glycosyltransferase family protein [Cytophagaceae bacterium]